MHPDTQRYNASLGGEDQAICDLLALTIDTHLCGMTPEVEVVNRIWHRHPVWFLDGNPIVGYSKQKAGLRLMFWSGASFDEPLLGVRGGKFQDASIFYSAASQVDVTLLQRWLAKSAAIQWDYQNIVKNRGLLQRRALAPTAG